MDVLSYKGYKIQATPYRLADTGEWTIEINIVHDRGDQIHSRPFSSSNSYKTREEAVAHCFNFGKQIIDENFENPEKT